MARIAVVLGPDFEDSEFEVPHDKLREAGHQVTVLGIKGAEQVRGKRGHTHRVDGAAEDASPDDFDALVIPGGYSPDHLRTDQQVVSFVRRFFDTGRLVASICHGPQLLIEADVVRDRHLTSWPSVRTDLENAGARWIDEEVVVDGSLVTSRKPGDLEAFTAAILRRLR